MSSSAATVIDHVLGRGPSLVIMGCYDEHVRVYDLRRQVRTSYHVPYGNLIGDNAGLGQRD